MSQQNVTEMVISEVKKWVSNSIFLILVGAFLWLMTPLGNQIKAIWNSPQNNQKQFEEILEFQEQSKQTQQRILGIIESITGEDKILRMPDDMSFIQEPVDADDPFIELVLFAGRTERGANCILREYIPKYTDNNNVVRSMEPRKARTQIGTAVTRQVIRINRPLDMPLGRTGVNLQLEYVCDGITEFENTRTVYFYNN